MDNNTKHTEGPWLRDCEGTIKRQLTDADGNHAGYELLIGDYRELNRERDELLAASKLMLLKLKNAGYAEDSDWFAIQELSAAIAKAEGK